VEIKTIEELPPVSRWRSRGTNEEHQEILDILESGQVGSVEVADKKEHERFGQKVRGVARRNNIDVRIVFNPDDSTTNFQLKEDDTATLTDEDDSEEE
jgi:hypothetical protein